LWLSGGASGGRPLAAAVSVSVARSGASGRLRVLVLVVATTLGAGAGVLEVATDWYTAAWLLGSLGVEVILVFSVGRFLTASTTAAAAWGATISAAHAGAYEAVWLLHDQAGGRGLNDELVYLLTLDLAVFGVALGTVAGVLARLTARPGVAGCLAAGSLAGLVGWSGILWLTGDWSEDAVPVATLNLVVGAILLGWGARSALAVRRIRLLPVTALGAVAGGGALYLVDTAVQATAHRLG
jgi:hypothetical protein